MLKKLGHQKGLTLIEALIAVGLVTIVLGPMTYLYISIHRNYAAGSAYLDIHADIRLALDWIEKDIRWARRVVASHGSYSTSTTSLILELPSINNQGDIIGMESCHDYIIYHLNDNTLERGIDANDDPQNSRTDDTRTIAENIDSLTFSSNGTNLSLIGDPTSLTSITIGISASKTRLGRTFEETSSSTVKLRNK